MGWLPSLDLGVGPSGDVTSDVTTPVIYFVGYQFWGILNVPRADPCAQLGAARPATTASHAAAGHP